MIRTDILVLGAGMVGIATALHLQARSRSVALVDRRGPAEETSFGNAGLIQREGVVPYGFPQRWSQILRYALNREVEAHYHLRALPKIAPMLFAYWRNGAPERIAASARANRPLIERCLDEHEALMRDAGMLGAIRRTGWLKVLRTPKVRDAVIAEQSAFAREYGFRIEPLDTAGVKALEPHLAIDFAGGLHMPEPWSIAEPGAVGKAYAQLFEKRGGRLLKGDARSVEQTREGWRVATEAGPVEARETVVALGPWSGELLRPLGYRFPLFVKRGYHRHYRAAGNAALTRPVIDPSAGFALTPAGRGIKLTSGAEFATLDAPPTPVQLARAEPLARAMFPLAEAVEAAPWLGRRPCLPDMLPIVGRAPRHPSLWLHFGHHHLGFTLGPTTGRLMAEMITGETPFADPAPYRAERF